MATPSDQIVRLIAPLRSAANGTYTLALQLHPAELGPVTVRVAVEGGVLSARIYADQPQGHDALRGSLADLRSQLQVSGVNVGSLDVGLRVAAPQQGGQAGMQNANNGSQGGQLGAQQGGLQHGGAQGNQHGRGHNGGDGAASGGLLAGYDDGARRGPSQSGGGRARGERMARTPRNVTAVTEPGTGALAGGPDDDVLDVRI